MKKQTAVNYVRDEAIKLVTQAMQGILNEDTIESEISQIVTTALQMEKEQIIEAYMKAKLEHIDTLGLNAMKKKIIKSSEDYYNKTY